MYKSKGIEVRSQVPKEESEVGHLRLLNIPPVDDFYKGGKIKYIILPDDEMNGMRKIAMLMYVAL